MRYYMLKQGRDWAFSRWIAPSFESFDRTSRVSPPFLVHDPQVISVGEWVRIGPRCDFVCSADGRLTIGDGVWIVGSMTIWCSNRIEIGRRALFARNVTLLDTQHTYADRDIPIHDQPWDTRGPVRIGEGAWLGVNSVVMPGVTVGRNAIVGANSVVTRDIPDYGRAVGVPAQLLDERSS
jgi:acetyltransferase-like isoleucine patch superfamily enzyme